MSRELTQLEIDALWLLARVDLSLLDPSLRGARGKAQLRLQHLYYKGIINYDDNYNPILFENPDE